MISHKCVSCLQHPKHFSKHDISSMSKSSRFKPIVQKEKMKLRKVKWLVQSHPNRKWQNQTDPAFLAFSNTWGFNQALQNSLIPGKTFMTLEVTDTPWSIWVTSLHSVQLKAKQSTTKSPLVAVMARRMFQIPESSFRVLIAKAHSYLSPLALNGHT